MATSLGKNLKRAFHHFMYTGATEKSLHSCFVMGFGELQTYTIQMLKWCGTLASLCHSFSLYIYTAGLAYYIFVVTVGVGCVLLWSEAVVEV